MKNYWPIELNNSEIVEKKNGCRAVLPDFSLQNIHIPAEPKIYQMTIRYNKGP
jgi:hypothetical protein